MVLNLTYIKIFGAHHRGTYNQFNGSGLKININCLKLKETSESRVKPLFEGKSFTRIGGWLFAGYHLLVLGQVPLIFRASQPWASAVYNNRFRDGVLED